MADLYVFREQNSRIIRREQKTKLPSNLLTVLTSMPTGIKGGPTTMSLAGAETSSVVVLATHV